MRPLGGDPLLDLAESADIEPRCIARSGDGRAETYAYRGYRFTIERAWVTWWCHGGAHRPGDPLALCHEAGWVTWGRRRIVRKLHRAIDRRERERGRMAEVAVLDDVRP